jgi:hypothetical protein
MLAQEPAAGEIENQGAVKSMAIDPPCSNSPPGYQETQIHQGLARLLSGFTTEKTRDISPDLD